jgi:hypothetical protein
MGSETHRGVRGEGRRRAATDLTPGPPKKCVSRWVWGCGSHANLTPQRPRPGRRPGGYVATPADLRVACEVAAQRAGAIRPA